MSGKEKSIIIVVITIFFTCNSAFPQNIGPQYLAITQSFIKNHLQTHKVGELSLVEINTLYFNQQVVKRNNINSYLEIVASKSESSNTHIAEKNLIVGIIHPIEINVPHNQADTSFILLSVTNVETIQSSFNSLFDLHSIKSPLISIIMFKATDRILTCEINYRGSTIALASNIPIEPNSFDTRNQRFPKEYSYAELLNNQISLLRDYGIQAYEEITRTNSSVTYGNMIDVADNIKSSKQQKDNALIDDLTQKTFLDYTFSPELTISVEYPNEAMIYLWINGSKHRIPTRIFENILDSFLEY